MLQERPVALAAAQAAQGNVAGSFSGNRNTPSEVLQERSVTSAAAEQCRGELQERSAARAAAEQCCGSIAGESCKDVLYAPTAPQSSTRAPCGSRSVCDLVELFPFF